MAPRSVYSDIVLQYRVHIGADIGEKPDIGGGKKRGSHNLRRYRRHIGADIVFFTDIGEKTHDIGGGKKRGSHNLRRYRRHIGADIGVNLPISVSYRGRYDADIGLNYGTRVPISVTEFGTPILSELSDIVS